MIPSVTTKQWVIDSVADRWKRQYTKRTGDWDNSKDGRGIDKIQVYEQLVVLQNPSEEVVAKIIGNSGWTELVCDQCKRRDCMALVTVGAEPDYDSSTSQLCLECIQKDLDALRLEMSVA